jgi:hypothetical protein
MEFTIKLNEDAIKAIINLMGETQTKQGFFPLMVEVNRQFEEQKSKLN